MYIKIKMVASKNDSLIFDLNVNQIDEFKECFKKRETINLKETTGKEFGFDLSKFRSYKFQ